MEQYLKTLLERMHDIGGYIDTGGYINNLFDELPKHLNKNCLVYEVTRTISSQFIFFYKKILSGKKHQNAK